MNPVCLLSIRETLIEENKFTVKTGNINDTIWICEIHFLLNGILVGWRSFNAFSHEIYTSELHQTQPVNSLEIRVRDDFLIIFIVRPPNTIMNVGVEILNLPGSPRLTFNLTVTLISIRARRGLVFVE